MKTTILCYGIVLLLAFTTTLALADTDIIFIRHGEKWEAGLGQLTCRGLNRALALPDVIASKYGRPDAVFAPNPSIKMDRGHPYSYVRPLATVEPTAIRYGLPVEAGIRYDDIVSLNHKLKEMAATGKYQRILVGWEHHFAEKAVNNLLSSSGAATLAPQWKSDDFDSIYIVRLTTTGKASFRQEFQLLNNLLSDQCPEPAALH